MARKKNSRKPDELQAPLLDDKNFLKGIIETFCQRCQFHFLHNLLDLVPKKRREEITAEIRSIFDSPDLYFANLRVRELVEKYKDTYPEFSQKLDEEVEETLSCFHFPSGKIFSYLMQPT